MILSSWQTKFRGKLRFRKIPNQSGLQKTVLGGVIIPKNWTKHQQQLQENSGIKLPDHIPHFQHVDQQIPINNPDGNRQYMVFDDLESLLAPALFCLPGRPAVITPIQRKFAEPLLEHLQQGSLLPSARSSLFQERHYLSAPRNLKHFKRGTLILFYESGRMGGSCSVVAIARVRRAYLKTCGEIGSDDLEQSVLSKSNVQSIGASKTKTIAVFDNIFLLPHPVSLKVLCRLGCGADTQLISTNPISDHQLQNILQEAFGYVS